MKLDYENRHDDDEEEEEEEDDDDENKIKGKENIRMHD